MECAVFFHTAYGRRNLLASLRRSGTNYLDLMLNLAHAHTKYGEADYCYENKVWKTNETLMNAFDFRTPMGKGALGPADIKTSDNEVIYHTHEPPSNILNLQRNRMKTVILVRNIFDQLFSYMFFCGFKANDQKTFLNSRHIDYVVRFYNEWGELAQNRDDCLVIQYRNLVKDPETTVKQVSSFYILGLDEDAIARSVAMTTKEEMAKRIPGSEKKTNTRLSSREKDVKFSLDSVEMIRDIIRTRIKYDFGYNYADILT